MVESEATGYASPACYAHEVDPTYNGAIPDAELAAVLNVVLEVERASAKALTTLVAEFDHPEVTDLLGTVQRNQSRCCGVLTRIVTQLGSAPSDATSSFHDEILGLEAVAERLALLNSGMAWVIGQLDGVLPRIPDDDLHGALKELRETHEVDLRDCSKLLDWLAAGR
jgi:nitronate monooxygenase